MADNRQQKSNTKKRERSEIDSGHFKPSQKSGNESPEEMDTGSGSVTPTPESSPPSSLCSGSTNIDSAMENGIESEDRLSDDGVKGPETKRSANEAENTAAKEQLAEQKKVEGNSCYSQKDYLSAARLYTEAIELCPTCAAYYGNRAAAYMMLFQYEKALDDSRRSTQIDSAFVKGYHREAKCHLAMGEVATATLLYEKIIAMEPDNKTYQSECQQSKNVQLYISKAEENYAKQEYRHVMFCMDKCIELSPECRKFKILEAECLAMLKRYQEAQDIVNDIVRVDSMSADAIYVRGLCLYYQDNIEKAFQHFQQVLRLAPDHSKAKDVYRKAKALTQKKEEGNNAFKQSRIQEAFDLYTEALAVDPNNVFTNSKLYCNRATAAAKLKKPEIAIDDCTKAIKLDENYVKAYLRRAKSYMETEQYEEAVRDYEQVFRMDKSRENKQLLQDAKFELKKSKRKDYYKILGLEKNADDEAIKKAYRKHALLHHPDRHMSASEDIKKAEEKKFKEIGEAYGILSDPKKKARYDSGQDLEEHEGMGGFSDIDPNLIFQSFFGGGGPGFGGGGFQFQQQGFPGAFNFQFG